MGEQNIRLNPQIDSIRSRVLLERAVKILLAIALMLPTPEKRIGKGRRPYDYRIVLVLCILRVLLRKKYSDYGSEMRFDKRLMEMFQLDKLPSKTTLNDYEILWQESQLIYLLDELPLMNIYF
jgi:hypothetical protein